MHNNANNNNKKNTYIQSHKQKIYEQKVDMLVATVQR